MTGFEGSDGGISGTGSCSLGCAFFPGGALAFHASTRGSDYDGFGNFFLGHSLTADFAFVADRAEAVLARHARYRRDQRGFAVGQIDIVEAQDNARAKSGQNSADVAFDLAAFRQGHAVYGGQRLGETGVEMVSGFYGARVDAIRQLD